MIIPNQNGAVHKAWMYRLLSEIAEDSFLVALLRFKGGTCAAMRGFLQRFSVDLDFDLIDETKINDVQQHLEMIFKKIGLTVKDKSRTVPQYFLQYPVSGGQNVRKTLKLDMAFPVPKNNKYEPVRLVEIDRIMYCQTIETMFANKLLCPIGRYKKRKSIAGRDIFDVQSFFLNGYKFDHAIIKEISGKVPVKYLRELKNFIVKHVTQTDIDQDLNTLLPPDNFKKIRKFIKQETIMLLNDEITRLQKKD